MPLDALAAVGLYQVFDRCNLLSRTLPAGHKTGETQTVSVILGLSAATLILSIYVSPALALIICPLAACAIARSLTKTQIPHVTTFSYILTYILANIAATLSLVIGSHP